MTEFEPLTYDAEPGTGVEVQSDTHPERFYQGVVREDGKVRMADRHAIFNANTYSVLGAK